MHADVNTDLGLDGEYLERELPLLIRRIGMAAWTAGRVRILDRRRLPHEEVYVDCSTVEDVARAIESMTIQGAFTLALAAGYGLALAVPPAASAPAARERIALASQRLGRTRPTGLALGRVLRAAALAADEALAVGEDPVRAIVASVDRAASVLARQALAAARRANALLEDGKAILTHCFADRTFLYLLLEARRAGKTVPVFCSETRPYLQGARLTALSVQQTGHPVTVVTDGMGGFLMRQGSVSALVTAADRVCLDGTVCNKIGTYQFALAARANDLPYYVLRQSGPDPESPSESDVTVEYRDEASVLSCGGVATTPPGVRGLYPAFDITPSELVTAIVTDRGIFPAAEIARYFSAETAPSGPVP